jgi:hydroxymethylbilane synthase
MKIFVGARASALSRAQVAEVLSEIQYFHPEITFEMIWVETAGDLNVTTSLRHMGKTNFFTRELDQMLLAGEIQVAIHSAKDLPEPLPEALSVAAITKGLDPRDSLVLRDKMTLQALPAGAKIATSSLRREENVRILRSDLTFIDVRGTIEKRLEMLEKKEADGAVVAEAALIRLNLTHLNRIFLPGDTAPLQGRLAIVTRSANAEMISLFSVIHEYTLSGS